MKAADADCVPVAGVIPASFSDQLAAQRLAMCNDIGEASYVDSCIAAALLQVFRGLPTFPAISERLLQRFKIPLEANMTGTCPEKLNAFALASTNSTRQGTCGRAPLAVQDSTSG